MLLLAVRGHQVSALLEQVLLVVSDAALSSGLPDQYRPDQYFGGRAGCRSTPDAVGEVGDFRWTRKAKCCARIDNRSRSTPP